MAIEINRWGRSYLPLSLWRKTLSSAASENVGASENAQTRPRLPAALVWLSAVALIVISAARIVSTYTVFSQFWDEPAHIACGLEWWQDKVYHLEPQHPPLARIAIAGPLYLTGIRVDTAKGLWQSGNAALIAGGHYVKNLALARSGTLLYWLLGCLILFIMCRSIFSDTVALVTLVLASTLPPLLGYAGLAYTDMALTTGMLLFTWRLARFVVSPGLKNAIWLGVAMGVAIMSKYSAIPYIGVSTGLTLLVVMRSRGWHLVSPRTLRPAATLLLSILLTMFVLLWACFRFSLEPLSNPPGQRYSAIDRRVGASGVLHNTVYAFLDTPLPLMEVVKGLRQVAYHAREGHPAYTFGKARKTGTLYYFPAMLVLTLPLGMLVLSLIGLGYVLTVFRRTDRQKIRLDRIVVFLVPLSVMAVNATSSINIGYRHNLAVYPFACLLAAIAFVALWRRTAWVWRALALGLLGQCLISSTLAHPDYATYANALAGDAPEKYCASSFSGGDVWRLSARLKELGASHVCLALDGVLPLDEFDLPSYTRLKPNVPCEGLAAVGVYRSLTELQEQIYPDTGLNWLSRERLLERVGKSILLYEFHSPHAVEGGIATPEALGR